MVDPGVANALKIFMTFFGAFIFVLLKFVGGKMFKGWKGILAKGAMGFGFAVLAAISWAWCPGLGVILGYATIIMGGLIGFAVLFLSQFIPVVGTTASYVLVLIAPVIYILIVIAVLELIVDIVGIVLLFVPGVGWAVDVILIIISLLLPIISLVVIWTSWAGAFGALGDCILGIGRTTAIPGTGGIMIGAVK